MITCTKRFDNIPFAHRQPNHDGHCSLIHGHNWSFEFEFAALIDGPGSRLAVDSYDLHQIDKNGFVVDFGNLKWLKQWLDEQFDHALVLNEEDPYLNQLHGWLMTLQPPLAKITPVPNCGAEGLASYVSGFVRSVLQNSGRVKLVRLTVFEDSKNSATIRFE